jgi:hypothetical protein
MGYSTLRQLQITKTNKWQQITKVNKSIKKI